MVFENIAHHEDVPSSRLSLLHSTLVCNQLQLAKSSKGLGQEQPGLVDFYLFYKRLLNCPQSLR